MSGVPGAAPGERPATGRGPQPGASSPWPSRSSDQLPGPAPSDEAGTDAEPVPGGTILTDAAALAAERDEYLGALQRLQADFENYRKRVARQQEEQAVRAALDLVGKVLPVLDTLDLARAHLGGEGGNATEEAKALDQARSQLLDVLGKEGLERVDQAGVAFDPVVHDAVAHAPADAPAEAGDAEGGDAAGAADDDPEPAPPAPPAAGEPGGVAVDEVLRAGYRWRGQVLRPAMVRVRG